jgi:hypothetical protein
LSLDAGSSDTFICEFRLSENHVSTLAQEGLAGGFDILSVSNDADAWASSKSCKLHDHAGNPTARRIYGDKVAGMEICRTFYQQECDRAAGLQKTRGARFNLIGDLQE